MRSQDVHSAYMPYFRAQMNCVPGMVTQFAFTQYTLQMSIESCHIWLKRLLILINFVLKKYELVAKGGSGLDPYTFDYLLLCNKNLWCFPL
jgi:cytochrome c oxidase subunit 2